MEKEILLLDNLGDLSNHNSTLANKLLKKFGRGEWVTEPLEYFTTIDSFSK